MVNTDLRVRGMDDYERLVEETGSSRDVFLSVDDENTLDSKGDECGGSQKSWIWEVPGEKDSKKTAKVPRAHSKSRRAGE